MNPTEILQIVDAVRDDAELTEIARTVHAALREARWQGLGDWDQARYVAHVLSEQAAA